MMKNIKRYIQLLFFILVIFILTSCGKEQSQSKVVDIYSAEEGDTVCFGSYYFKKTDKDTQPMEWIVLKKEDDKLLLISKYVIEQFQYHAYAEATNWEKCTLRKSLNKKFLDETFSNEERQLILTTTITGSNNSGYRNLEPDNDTRDKIFILDDDQISEYFDVKGIISSESQKSLVCKATPAAISAGVRANSSGEAGWWVLSPGSCYEKAKYINSSGRMSFIEVDNWDVGTRPALWLSVKQ